MEESFTGGWYPDLSSFVNMKRNREDFIADADSKPMFQLSNLGDYSLKEAKANSIK